MPFADNPAFPSYFILDSGSRQAWAPAHLLCAPRQTLRRCDPFGNCGWMFLVRPDRAG